MKRKFICVTVVFIVFLISTVILTVHHYNREYKIDAWKTEKYFEITGFSVKPGGIDSLNMFDDTFYVDVSIKGNVCNDLFNYFLEYVHKNERFEYVDGEKAVIVEFAPVFTYNMFAKTNYKKYFHEEKFRYNLKSYDYNYKKYIFRCGDFEEVISFYSGK